MAKKKILLIGNGFNLVSDGGASWNALLNNLAGTPKTKHESEVRKAKPFTLWFEEIAKGGLHSQLKQKIAEDLESRVAPNKYHKDLMALNFQHILTTNYDYNLEAADGGSWIPNFPARETFYSLFRRRSSGNRHVWHIHGELDIVGSIMLGHEQYSGYIHKIRNFLTSGVETNAKARDGKPYLSKFSRNNKGSLADVESWVDLFLEHEVHIIGFGLDYTENHLWNLITEKERLKRKRFPIAQAVFHRCSDKKQSTVDEARMSIMSALGVRVIDHVGASYAEAYDACVASFR
ncbi:MAG: SIR2 family protein [Rhodocyclales bacterium]|nr:SIR2 family protein [Rhodocyclales bacterium]